MDITVLVTVSSDEMVLHPSFFFDNEEIRVHKVDQFMIRIPAKYLTDLNHYLEDELKKYLGVQDRDFSIIEYRVIG